MRALLTTAAGFALAVSTGLPLAAQMHDNTEKQMSCQNGGFNGDQARHCEIREQSWPAIGQLTVDPGRNGGATVKGWVQSGVLVRSKIEAWGETEGAAANMASRVFVDGSGGAVRSTGPESINNGGWSVSYEIFVPQNTNLTVNTHNGGISVFDVRGQIHFETTNGGVHLRRVAGDVKGSTTNGGVEIDLVGNSWDGRQLEVSTKNGGVTVAMPRNYSAHIQAETGLGGIESDFPTTLNGDRRSRKMDANLGAGGPLIHITTGNGHVRLKSTD